MKHNWSTICQRSLTDQDTNQISLVDCLEQLNLPSDAFGKNLNLRLEIISYFTGFDASKDRKVKRTIKLFDPQDNELNDFKVEELLDIPKNFSRFRLRSISSSFPITTPGTYKFKIFASEGKDDLTEVAELEIDVMMKNK